MVEGGNVRLLLRMGDGPDKPFGSVLASGKGLPETA